MPSIKRIADITRAAMIYGDENGMCSAIAVYMPAVIVDADIAGIKYSIVGVNLMEILVFSKLSNPLIT
ncbi:hypothetical protein FACI_IFERC00001G0093 [Ferroplasma acidarmanus Fer1]|uniref:Uncharacterized protein n=1 Tax=Ferroplasma acidarmanus Fer1 TaxID=333146 RepID=S0AL29_FERAC|nr:hypothetical protein FACI_IFERC00001G0093 [Ferroplasma acidarmanus Fer1]